MYPYPNIGILGGGQLGKMMGLAVADWHLKLHFLDTSADMSAGIIAGSFTEGSFKSYDDVYSFGKDKDIITIEIEHVNTDALEALEKEGKIIHPAPKALRIIQDKGLQKQFYANNEFPTSPFTLYEDKAAIVEAIEKGALAFPFVQKTRTAGYDGKGVAVIKDKSDLSKLMDAASLIEDLVDIKKEIAVIAARRPSGEIVAFPVVEMEFNPIANLVEYLICPAKVSEQIAQTANELAVSLIEKMDVCGLLAVEMFLTHDDQVLINEVAPRPHNSGHHTIDSCYTSQFEQHIRAIMDVPLGSTALKTPGIMVNILGHPDYTGPVLYKGMDDCLALPGVNIHLYGKATTKPFRKMGHMTVVNENLEEARKIAEEAKKRISVISE
ncbi:MAG: 5-(carboxyamino)imidazole ribonucleotide synthase [Bacteroidota bacterium]